MIKNVLFICGAGHSGSTLLGLILGSHSRGFYMGEAKKTLYLYDEKKPAKKRYCKICGPDCRIWQPFHHNQQQGLTIYENLETIIDSEIVIDSSKNTNWIDHNSCLAQKQSRNPGLIFLKRDGRAVVNSRIRKYSQQQPEEHIKKWQQQMAMSNELYDSFRGAKMEVLYHELTARPEETIQKICQFFSIPYEPQMLAFYNQEHHPLGGNNGTQSLLDQARKTLATELTGAKKEYFANHPQAIKHDSRWKQQLTAENLQLFETLAGSTNVGIEED